MKLVQLAAAASTIIFSSHALADHASDRRWHITPMAGYIWADNDRDSVEKFDGGVGQINIGKAVSEHFDVDLRLQYLDMGDFLDQTGAGLEATWLANRNAGITPLVSIGAGWVDNNVKASNISEDSWVADIGLGLQAKLNQHGMAFRGEVRQRWDDRDNEPDNYSDTLALVGLMIPLGSLADNHPQTVTVLDSDNDGVADSKDACPGTPAGIHTDSAGCPVDSDRDGVADGADLCPNTAAGTNVDNNGCPQTQAAVAPELIVVHFELDSAELSEAAKAKLQTVSNRMIERKYIVAVATGYTDSTGSEEYNLALSRKRAENVRSYLVERGVRTANLIAKGVGEADPSASNDTDAGRASNRRVEVRLLDQ
jgi:OOP family OmpA-OmpF porin